MITSKSQKPMADGLSLIGFRLNPDSERPDVFTLMIYGETDSPVMVDNQIIFFNNPELVYRVFELLTDDIKSLSPPPIKVDLICDVAEALYTIDNQDTDTSSTILNCINTILDLVRSAEQSIPDRYKTILHSFADHLTFNREFASFLKQRSVKREEIIDALLWCIGGIVVRAKLL